MARKDDCELGGDCPYCRIAALEAEVARLRAALKRVAYAWNPEIASLQTNRALADLPLFAFAAAHGEQV